MKLALAPTKPRPTVSSVHWQCYLKLPTILLRELGLLLAHIATARRTKQGIMHDCSPVQRLFLLVHGRTGSEVVNFIQHGLSGSEVVYFTQHGLSGSEVVLVAEHGPAGSEVPILYF